MSMAITREEMLAWAGYIQEICGIQLDDSKRYLVETRLVSLLGELGAANYSELFYKVRSDVSNKLRSKVIELITTNETSFFRDQAPFEMLRHKIIPDLVDRRNRSGIRTPIRVWSAACSTGQEAYSTAIVFKELLGDMSRYDVRILGTDISNQVVAQASYGEFSRLQMDRGLPPETLARHFSLSGERWKVRDEIRSMVSFRTMNLLESYSFPNLFDIVFCRNVAIYFSEADKIKMFRNLSRYMAKDGCLIIGSTESITGLCPELEPKRHLRSVFYQWKQ
jgi:chemotaxis protein methyltransferase CheR